MVHVPAGSGTAVPEAVLMTDPPELYHVMFTAAPGVHPAGQSSQQDAVYEEFWLAATCSLTAPGFAPPPFGVTCMDPAAIPAGADEYAGDAAQATVPKAFRADHGVTADANAMFALSALL
jgi:hypothetical protein